MVADGDALACLCCAVPVLLIPQYVLPHHELTDFFKEWPPRGSNVATEMRKMKTSPRDQIKYVVCFIKCSKM